MALKRALPWFERAKDSIAELAWRNAGRPPEGVGESRLGRETEARGNRLNAFLGRETSLCRFNATPGNIVADGGSTTGSKSARELPHRQIAKTSQFREGRR